MKFYTQYERPSIEECPLEEHPDEGLVERAGYMETEQLVTQLIQAGSNLQAFREAEYGPDEEIPDDAPALRMPDKLDTILGARAIMQKIKDSQDAAKAAALLVKNKEEKEDKEEKKKDGSI